MRAAELQIWCAVAASHRTAYPSLSNRLDIRGADHFRPLLRFLCNELAEFGRRNNKCRGAQVCKSLRHVGVGEARVDLAVELVDNVYGHVLGHADPVKGARLVARYEFTHG